MKSSASIETTPVLPRPKRSRYVAEPNAAARYAKPDRDREALGSLLEEAADQIAVLLRGPRDPATFKHVGMSALQLLDRARTSSTADGWGNHSPGSDPPDAPPRNPDRELDDDKEGRPPHSDPTGGAAIAGLTGKGNADKTTTQHIARDVKAALEHLRGAVTELVKAQQADTTPAVAAEPACKSCARRGHFEPVSEKVPNSELCRWCYDFWLVHSQQPKLEILELHHQGKRITTTVMRQAGYKT